MSFVSDFESTIEYIENNLAGDIPELQGQGYGTDLLKSVESYIKEIGLAGFTLLTNRYTPAPDFIVKKVLVTGSRFSLCIKKSNLDL